MALPNETKKTFNLYVTYVDSESYFLKISGQTDQQSSLLIESLFEGALQNLENGIGAVPATALREGILCAAKFKDGTYYRARIISLSNLASGLVGVHFIDYGNKDIISLSTIRLLDNYDPMFVQLPGQATDYYLTGIMHHKGKWEETLILKLQSFLCYVEYPTTIEAQTHTLPIISVQFKGTDLSTHLLQNNFGISVPLARQEAMINQLANDNQRASSWQPNFLIEPPPIYPEHVPFLINRNFPANPASAMRLQQNVSILPFNGSMPPPSSAISQRLIVNRTSRNSINLKPPARQPQHANTPATPATPPPLVVAANKPTSPKKSSSTYKSRLLEINSQHKVFVSFAEEGPELFAVQLVTDAKKLQDMMDDINRRPHSSLKEPPMIGTVCLGRMSGDRIICRAIVMNLSGSQCKLFFVDFGDTEMVSYYDIFDIPEEFVKPNVFAMRFCLSGVKKLERGPYLNETFKQLVNGKVLTLKVVAPEGPPLIQYGELYLDNMNVLDLLLANMKEKLQLKWLDMLPLGSKNSVLVSYVDSCIKFYIQLSDNIDELNAVMKAVRVHCENTSSPGELPIGAACCAKFPDDGNWYRARVRETKGNMLVVAYVDYGNEQEVEVSDLRTITPELIKLPAQAMKCALKGFENKPVETKTSNQLEMLALEKTLMAHIVGVLSSDTMLVSLIDDTVTPPLDIARRMNQLSQPRCVEPKVTTPVRKDAPETFSSPEGSLPDDKKNYRREKSFRDERRPAREPREGSEDFAQRGGSFRSREGKDSFERSAPGRQSDKFGGRPDRGDRRGGAKPWENNNTTPQSDAPAAEEWDETPSQPSFQQHTPRERPFNRDSNRDNNRDFNRDNKRDFNRDNNRDFNRESNREKNRDFNRENGRDFNRENNRDSNRDSNRDFSRENNRDRDNNRDFNRDRRKPRSDHHASQKPGWKNRETGGVGKRLRQAAEAASADTDRPNVPKASVQDRLKRDRKENWNQKRDFKDNRSERGERGERAPRSNFTPRERAERDRTHHSGSEKSFHSQDGSGRAPPYKSRGKFTQAQYKELAEPVPLDEPFVEPTVELGAQHEISVTWIISPENFYTQILSLQPKFLEMMHKIPELYKGVKSYTGSVPEGSSVLARYPLDGVLYRATVVAVQPFSKFIVRYVDFGNKQLVDAKDIWQLDRELMELPKMAVHCSLLGVAPADGEWKSNPEIDLCFNAPRYQCIFQEFADNQFRVSLWNNGVSVADTLVEKQLAVMSEQQPSATLKDEAIDLTIVVGQQILCKVTHVESYEKFYVQLDLDKAELVENAVAAFDVNQLAPLAAESLTEGVHCTVKHEGSVYRAILADAADTANIRAVLPDYGNTIVTSPDNLMILPTELSVYYYQSLECCLNNYTSESNTLMTLEELKSRLTGNKFIVYINDVEGISLVTTLYDVATGRKVAAFEPDEGAYDEVAPLCMRAVFNHNFGLAYASHAESLNELYLQRAADTDAIALLLDRLFAFYEEGTPEALTSFDVEGLCAAKSADGNWYRATITNTTDTEAKVQYPDYGNTETVAKDSLKKLDPLFFEPCAFAVVVGLGLVALQDDAVNKLVEWTQDKAIQVTLTVGSDGWLANLHLDGVDLSMKLVDDKLATLQQESQEEEQKPEAVTEEPISLPAGCTQVYISHIDSPGQFWLQMSDKVNTIDEIQAELQAKVETYPDIDSREMGTLCVARYSADDQWYRAEILDADSDITTVRFIDYGNTDVLDNQPGLLKVIPDHLRDSERYAVKASVNAVPTGTGQWSEPASDYFTQLCGDLSLPVDALIVLKDVTTYVDIFVNGQNLTDKLVSEGHATRSEEAECGDLPSCFASHVNSPSEFWIQLEAATSELQAMENAMVDAENFPELVDKEEGVICAAKYPEDGAWYRAQVIVDGSEGTEVLFMDYGNASIATELRSLPDELKVKPALSRKCALQKPRDIKSWSRKSEVKFTELAAEGATIFNVQFIASGDISIVELYQEGKSVTEELVELCEEQPTSERPTPVGHEYVGCSGKVAHFNSLEDFYVHLDESITDLERITNKLVNGFEFDPVPELKVGSMCAALWSEDELWYRAKIQQFTDDGYLVLFIDHGNEATCEPSQIKHLPEDLAGIEPLAKCCRLAGINENEDLKKKLASYLASEECGTFQIEFLDSTKVPALVRLLLDGEDICTSTLIPELIDTVTTDIFKDDIGQIDVVEEMDIVKECINEIETEIVSEVSKVVDLDPKADNKEIEANNETDIVKSIVNEVDTCKETELSDIARKETAVQGILESILDNTVTTKSEPLLKANNETNKEHKEPDEEISKSKSVNDFDLSEALNTSLPELDDSIDSSNTVIENTSFERKDQDLMDIDDCSNQNLSTSTVEDENKHPDEVIVESNSSPEKDISKESISIDTGYMSGNNVDTSLAAESESTKQIEASKESSPEELGQVAEKEVVTVDSCDQVVDVNKT